MKALIPILIGIFGLVLFKSYKAPNKMDNPLPIKMELTANPTIDSVVTVKIEMIAEMQYFSDGMIVKKEGYNPQKQLVYKYTFLNGLKHGTWEEYYNNGQQYLELNYFNGLRNGSQRVYNSDGSYQYWVEWINDVQLSRLEYPQFNENIRMSPAWKKDGC